MPRGHKQYCNCSVCKVKRGEIEPWNKGLSGEEYLKHYEKRKVWNSGLEGKEYTKHFKNGIRCLGGCNKKLEYWGVCNECRKSKNFIEHCKKGGNIFVEKYGGWGAYHNIFREQHYEEYYRRQKENGRKGGKVMTFKHGGWAWADHSENGRRAVEINRKNKTGPFFDPELHKIVCSLGGKACIKKHGGWAWVNHVENGFKRIEGLREKKSHYFYGIAHDSEEEKEVSKIFYNVGMPLIIGKTIHIRVGRKEIDWRADELIKFGIRNNTFIEYHPCPQFGDKRTFEEYYKDRRKVLDENGFEKDGLIVFQSIKEVDGFFD